MAAPWSGKQCADYFAQNTRQASSNYCIGINGDIACSVEEENAAWTSSNWLNDSYAITIECGNINNATGEMTQATWNSLVNLCADICRRYGFTLGYNGTASGSLTTHKMFASTACPGAWLEARMSQLAKEVNAKLKGQSVPTQTISTPTPSCKYGVGTEVCTNTLWTQSNGGTRVVKDYSGTITRVIVGAEHPYLLNNGGGWTNDTAIDTDPHVPGKNNITQSSSGEAIDQVLHVGSHCTFATNLIVDNVNVQKNWVHCTRLGGWIDAGPCREVNARDGKCDQILNIGAQFTIDGKYTVGGVNVNQNTVYLKELGLWVNAEPLTEVA